MQTYQTTIERNDGSRVTIKGISGAKAYVLAKNDLLNDTVINSPKVWPMMLDMFVRDGCTIEHETA
jgi:hypothetical protein